MAEELHFHFLSRRPGGPIRTVRKVVSDGGGQSAVVCEGGEWLVACQPKRDHLARVAKVKKQIVLVENFLATGDPSVVSCPKCRESSYYLEDTRPPQTTKEV